MFKRTALILILGIFIGTMSFSVFAEDEGVFSEATVDGIKFRGIDWDLPKQEVDKILESQGIVEDWFQLGGDKETIDGWYKEYNYMYADPRVEDGGVRVRYDDVDVAGYKADLDVYYMFSINNGMVDYDNDKALFYKAEYSIEDMEDEKAVYDSLSLKLADLYGSSEQHTKDSISDDALPDQFRIFSGKDDSKCFLGVYYNIYDEKYDTVKIIYASPNTNGKLNDLIEKISLEALQNEEVLRTANQSNTDGL